MQRNGFAVCAIEELDFAHIDDDGYLIIIPIKNHAGYVQCENKKDGRAFLNEAIRGQWCCYQLDTTVRDHIYDKLEVDT